ncbi:MAG: molybdenum cofactor guanylyltransferase [Planctomycetales bacterium]
MNSPLRVGGIVLCGGRSSRMGTSKALLPFGPESMLQRVVRILQSVVTPIVVVGAAGQALPPLPPSVLIARDEQEALGPLAGLATGLAALRGKADAAFATACDVPLLNPDFVWQMIRSLGEADLAIPRVGDYDQTLAAVYRITVEPVLRELLQQRELRLGLLRDRVRTQTVEEASLRVVDPQLLSLWNANTPEDYSTALQMARLTRAAPTE